MKAKKLRIKDISEISPDVVMNKARMDKLIEHNNVEEMIAKYEKGLITEEECEKAVYEFEQRAIEMLEACIKVIDSRIASIN